MADFTDDAGFQGSLTPEQKTYFEKALPTWKEASVNEFKTQSEEARKKAVPEKYEFKFADGSPLDPKDDADKIAAFAREHNLPAEQAQKYLDLVNERAQALLSRQAAASEAAAETLVKEFDTATWNDPELGGKNRPVTEKRISLALGKFASEAFAQMVNDAKTAKNPEFMRFLASIGKALEEDKLPKGGEPVTKVEHTPGSRIYKNSSAA